MLTLEHHFIALSKLISLKMIMFILHNPHLLIHSHSQTNNTSFNLTPRVLTTSTTRAGPWHASSLTLRLHTLCLVTPSMSRTELQHMTFSASTTLSGRPAHLDLPVKISVNSFHGTCSARRNNICPSIPLVYSSFPYECGSGVVFYG